MSTGYKIEEQDSIHFVTFQIVNWIDIFTRKENRDIIVESLKFCQKEKGLEVYAYVIMSNHVHLLLRSSKGCLSNTIREFKSFTAKEILSNIEDRQESRRDWMLQLFKFAAKKHKRNSNFQLWSHENHAVLIFSNSFLDQKINYIHDNPVRAGIVELPEDYLYSSARSYSGKNGLLDISFVNMPVERIPLLRKLK